MKKIILSVIAAVLICGCKANTQQNINEEFSDSVQTQLNDNVYKFENIGDSNSYFCISDSGLDYMIPKLAKEWSLLGKNADTDCSVYTNSVNSSRFVIIRNIDVENREDGGYDKVLNGSAISGYLEQQIATHIGKKEEISGELEHFDNMKFYNVSGRTEFNEKQFIYKGIYFQSKLYRPSVHKKKVPTGIIIMYEDGKDTEQVLEMLEVLKNNMKYDN